MLYVIAPVRVCPSPDNCLVVLRHIKDVAVPLVHHGPGDVVHLPHYGLPLPFHMKQFRRLVLNIVTKPRLKNTIKIQFLSVKSHLGSSTEVSNAFLEVSLEPGGLLSLDLPVLDGRPAQMFVQLHRLVGSNGGLVGGGLLAQPEVDVLLHSSVMKARLHSLTTAGPVRS